jgi:hypothetical protein
MTTYRNMGAVVSIALGAAAGMVGSAHEVPIVKPKAPPMPGAGTLRRRAREAEHAEARDAHYQSVAFDWTIARRKHARREMLRQRKDDQRRVVANDAAHERAMLHTQSARFAASASNKAVPFSAVRLRFDPKGRPYVGWNGKGGRHASGLVSVPTAAS